MSYKDQSPEEPDKAAYNKADLFFWTIHQLKNSITVFTLERDLQKTLDRIDELYIILIGYIHEPDRDRYDRLLRSAHNNIRDSHRYEKTTTHYIACINEAWNTVRNLKILLNTTIHKQNLAIPIKEKVLAIEDM